MAKTELSQLCDKAFLELPVEVKKWLNEKSVRNKTSNNVTIGKMVMSDYREHIEDSKKSIVSFSGGKDSTALLLMMLERGMKVDYILFCDTGMEYPQMYEHIDKVEAYISEKYGKHITVLKAEHSFEWGLTQIVRKKGKRAGTHGYRWSSMKNRWCTTMLKREPVERFMREHGFNRSNTKLYIGIAADEPKRVHDDIYPLFEWGITEEQALQYCYRHGFDWGGLYKERSRLSCWICPMTKRKEFKLLYRDFPELWAKLKELNDKVISLNKTERHGVLYEYKQMSPTDPTLAEWEARFKKECEFESRERSLF